jgi:hypothetical protein
MSAFSSMTLVDARNRVAGWGVPKIPALDLPQGAPDSSAGSSPVIGPAEAPHSDAA